MILSHNWDTTWTRTFSELSDQIILSETLLVEHSCKFLISQSHPASVQARPREFVSSLRLGKPIALHQKQKGSFSRHSNKSTVFTTVISILQSSLGLVYERLHLLFTANKLSCNYRWVIFASKLVSLLDPVWRRQLASVLENRVGIFLFQSYEGRLLGWGRRDHLFDAQQNEPIPTRKSKAICIFVEATLCIAYRVLAQPLSTFDHHWINTSEMISTWVFRQNLERVWVGGQTKTRIAVLVDEIDVVTNPALITVFLNSGHQHVRSFECGCVVLIAKFSYYQTDQHKRALCELTGKKVKLKKKKKTNLSESRPGIKDSSKRPSLTSSSNCCWVEASKPRLESLVCVLLSAKTKRRREERRGRISKSLQR